MQEIKMYQIISKHFGTKEIILSISCVSTFQSCLINSISSVSRAGEGTDHFELLAESGIR